MFVYCFKTAIQAGAVEANLLGWQSSIDVMMAICDVMLK